MGKLVLFEIGKLLRHAHFHVALWATAAVTALAAAGKLPFEMEPFADQTGFAPMAFAARIGTLFAGVWILLIASASIAQEWSLGTIRTILVQPVRRSSLFFAKGIMLLFAVVVMVAVIGGVAHVTAGYLHGYSEVYTLDLEGNSISLFADYQEMYRKEIASIALSILPLCAFAAFGLLISSLFSNPVTAIAVCLMTFLIPLFLAFSFRSAEEWVFISYTVHFYNVLYKLGTTNASVRWMSRDVLLSIVTSLGAIFSLGGVALFAFRRKDIPV